MSSKQATPNSPTLDKRKKSRDFRERDEWEQDELLSTLWCDTCDAGNLEVINPQEYEVKGVVYLEATCPECGEPVVMTINEN